MNVFALKKGKAYSITVDNFEDMTKKDYPYYRINMKKKLQLYALCPECGNPVQVINLYGDEMMQNKTGLITTHAKHTSNRVSGFEFWDKDEKENCSLYNPTPLGNVEVRANDEFSEEIRVLIDTHKTEINKDIKRVIGINLSDRFLNNAYDVFNASRAYTYRAVNKYNIPYCILRYQPSLSIFGQFIRSCELGSLIIDAINLKSKYFEIGNTQNIIKRSAIQEYTNIHLILKRYRKKESKQFIQMEIYETLEDHNHHTIFKHELEIKPFIYD